MGGLQVKHWRPLQFSSEFLSLRSHHPIVAYGYGTWKSRIHRTRNESSRMLRAPWRRVEVTCKRSRDMKAINGPYLYKSVLHLLYPKLSTRKWRGECNIASSDAQV